MIVTYNWLKEFVDFDLDSDQLSHQLTMAGLEVDFMDKLGADFDSVIVAKLESVEPHPEADRLTVCQVNTGGEVIPVVCGATNHKSGDLIALAQVGSVLPGDFKIKKSKIRGAESRGMLCSEKELGLADDADGILILPQHLELGTPVFSALGLKDVRYEIGLTPNRADCLSVAGVAREVGAFVNKKIQLPTSGLIQEGDTAIEAKTSVTIDDAASCPRYMARLIEGVTIAPSPKWLVQRLESIGMRSINNVVDVTNYVLMELGHPLHAFDFNQLRGKKIVVKHAVEDSEFITLDEQTRQLKSTDIVICDNVGPIALAGVMGGENSEVQDSTVDILLESAYFDPISVRRTSKRLGIHTEASHRFERGADVDIVPIALDRAISLIQELAGGTVAAGLIDNYPQPLFKRKVTVTLARTNQLLGLNLTLDDIESLLNSIELDTEHTEIDGQKALVATIPMSRHDLEREVDLIEEIARLNGYDNIPTTMPISRVVRMAKDSRQLLTAALRDAMVSQGFSEIINYSFTSPTAWNKINLNDDDTRRDTIKILNPLTEEQSIMRTSLVPAMLETVARNLSYRSHDLSLFELRPVFTVQQGKVQPIESLRICAAITGKREIEGWSQSDADVDYYDLKGTVESVCQQLNVAPLRAELDGQQPYLHPGKSCRLYHDNTLLGVMGEIHPQVQENYDIDQVVYLVDLDMSALQSIKKIEKSFKPISRFPDSYRDSAFLFDEDVSAQQLFEVLAKVKVKNLDDVTLFDLYSGKGVPEGKKSLAIRARYRSMDKTFTDDEINAMHAKIVKSLQKNLGAEIR